MRLLIAISLLLMPIAPARLLLRRRARRKVRRGGGIPAAATEAR